jgi:hypothetical protein
MSILAEGRIVGDYKTLDGRASAFKRAQIPSYRWTLVIPMLRRATVISVLRLAVPKIRRGESVACQVQRGSWPVPLSFDGQPENAEETWVGLGGSRTTVAGIEAVDSHSTLDSPS